MEQNNREQFISCPKYTAHDLTDEQIDKIAEKAAEKAIQLAKDEFYMDVGKSIVRKIFWFIGFISFVLFVWAVKKGLISF